MKDAAKRHCHKIVARLVAEFWAKHRQDLAQNDSEIDSDSMRRGLFNSTVRVSDKVALHRQHLRELSDVLLTSLEKDYPHLRPSACESQLQETLEREYAGLGRKIPGWLHASNLLQDNIRSNFEQGLTRDCAEAKAHIRNSCALWEERWKEKRKWYRDPKWIAGIVVAVAIPMLGWFVPGWIRGNVGQRETSPIDVQREVPVDPNTGRTDLYARTKARVDEVTDFLVKEKVKRWLMIVGTRSKDKVTFHDGREVSYSDVEFEGTPRLVFWEGFIEPFLEVAIHQVLDDIGKECRDNTIDPSTPLAEAANCLDNMIWRVYREMANVDRRLRRAPSGSPIPKSIAEDVERKTKRMQAKVQEQLKAAIALYSGGD